MRLILVVTLLTGCGSFTQSYKMGTEMAIKIEVDRDLAKEKDVRISILSLDKTTAP